MKPDELVAENLGLRFSGLSEPDSPPDKRKKYDYSVETHLNGLDRQLQELLANIESGKANQEALTKFLQTLQQLRNWFEQLGEEYAQNFKSQKPQFS